MVVVPRILNNILCGIRLIVILLLRDRRLVRL